MTPKLGSTGCRYICFISAWTKITRESAGNPSESAGFPSIATQEASNSWLQRPWMRGQWWQPYKNNKPVTYRNHTGIFMYIIFFIYINPVIQSFHISNSLLFVFCAFVPSLLRWSTKWQIPRYYSPICLHKVTTWGLSSMAFDFIASTKHVDPRIILPAIAGPKLWDPFWWQDGNWESKNLTDTLLFLLCLFVVQPNKN